MSCEKVMRVCAHILSFLQYQSRALHNVQYTVWETNRQACQLESSQNTSFTVQILSQTKITQESATAIFIKLMRIEFTKATLMR